MAEGRFRRVLIAGGAGFLGRHLVRQYADAGAEVTVLDSFVTADPGLPVVGAARVIKACVTTPCDWPADLEAELIVNLACPASPAAYARMPRLTLESSVLGSRALAELALRCGAQLVHSSTSEVYGDPGVHPQGEEYAGHVAMSGPRACYDEGKRAAEVLLRVMAEEEGLNLRIARIFNTYGPGMRAGDGRAVPNFIHQGLTGGDITLHGDGAQTRSFCYVEDMVRGLVLLAESEVAGAGPVNLGNPVEVPLAEVAALIRDLTGGRSRIVREPRPENDPARRCPDITRAGKVLGFRPEVDLRDGLSRTVAAMRAGIDAAAV